MRALELAKRETGWRRNVLAVYYLVAGNVSLTIVGVGIALIGLGIGIDAFVLSPDSSGNLPILAGFLPIWGVSLALLGLALYGALWMNKLYARAKAHES